MAVGDLNGDGRVDVAATGYFGDNVYLHVLSGRSGGKFRLEEKHPLGFDPGNSATLMSDFDGDGHQDVLVVNQSESGFPSDLPAAFLFLGTGTLALDSSYHYFDNLGGGKVAAADLTATAAPIWSAPIARATP